MNSLPFNDRLDQYHREKKSTESRLKIVETHGMYHRSGKMTLFARFSLWLLKKANVTMAVIYKDISQ